jgi:hypothetical protein
LTNRQVAVLAAIERIGRPTLAELRFELSSLRVSDITGVAAGLVVRGLVAEAGDPPRYAAVPRDSRTGRRDSVAAGD